MRPAALELTSHEWKVMALERIEHLSIGSLISADHLRFDRYVTEPPRSSDWGGLFSAAHAAGLITHVGWQRSTHPGRKNGVQAVWQRIERKHNP